MGTYIMTCGKIFSLQKKKVQNANMQLDKLTLAINEPAEPIFFKVYYRMPLHITQHLQVIFRSHLLIIKIQNNTI